MQIKVKKLGIKQRIEQGNQQAKWFSHEATDENLRMQIEDYEELIESITNEAKQVASVIRSEEED